MSNHDVVVSLQSYAAVIAALGVGLDLRRALAHAEIPPEEWDRAAEHWQSRIDESAASDLALLVAFDTALLAAKRCFEPTIEPVESDPRAWAHFRRHFVTAVDPLAFLALHGLSLATYARLEADWANRILADEVLAAALQSHLEAKLEECPTLTRTPSPWLLPRDASAPSVREAPGLERGFGSSIGAPKTEDTGPEARTAPDPFAQNVPALSLESPVLPDLKPSVEHLTSTVEFTFGPSSPLDTMAPSLQAAKMATLPFKAGAPSTPAQLAQGLARLPELSPKPVRVAPAVATLPPPPPEWFPEAPKRVLPFPELASSSVKVNESPASDETAVLTAFAQQIGELVRGGLPFEAARDSQWSQTNRRVEKPAPTNPEITGDITATVQEQLRAMAASPLPFSTSPQPHSSVPTPKPTTSHGLPFDTPPTSHADPEDAPTLFRPQQSRSPHPSTEPPRQIPTLTVYAQICADLRVDPSRAASVRARYGLVDEKSWIAAHQYWTGRAC